MNLSSNVKNIKESVDAAIQSSNWSSGITIYDKEIKNSSDALQSLAEGTEKYQQEERDYCHLHILKAELLNLNEQKKSSKNVYVDCSEDPHCSKYIEMWKSYTDFYIKQNKDEKARQVFKSSLEKLSVCFILCIWSSNRIKTRTRCFTSGCPLNKSMDTQITKSTIYWMRIRIRAGMSSPQY